MTYVPEMMDVVVLVRRIGVVCVAIIDASGIGAAIAIVIQLQMAK